MTLKVKRIVVGSLDDKPIFTDQWQAVVMDGRKIVFASAGRHYATEARQAGIDWIERQAA